MDLLSNSIFQFIIGACLAVIGLWIAVRRTTGLPGYETLSQEHLSSSDPEDKQFLINMHVALDDTKIQHFQALTFRLWHYRRDPFMLDDEHKPLIISFDPIPVLAYQPVEIFPEDLDYRCSIEEEKLLLVLPRLEKGESLTLQIVVPEGTYGFPDMRIRGRAPQPSIKANNIRASKEIVVMGGVLLLLCAAALFLTTSSSQLRDRFWIFSIAGIATLIIGWMQRKTPPSRFMPPSAMMFAFFMLFIRSLPVLIPLSIIVFLIYWWFGIMPLALLSLIFMLIFAPLVLWRMLYTFILYLLQRHGKIYNKFLIVALTGIPFITFLGINMYFLILIFLGWLKSV